MSRQLKIAILKSGLNKIGGLEKYTLRLASFFAKANHQVTLLTTDWTEPADPLPSGIEIVNFGKRMKGSFLHLLYFDYCCRRWLSRHKYDVVLGLDRNFCLQTHYRAGNGCHAAYLHHRRQFSSLIKRASFICNPLHRLILAMERKTFTSSHLQKLFTNSEMVKREILEAYPSVDSEKIVVIHNGVEWQAMQENFIFGLEHRKEITKSLKLDPDIHQFLFIGNEYERKGLKVLLEALALLKKENWQLAVVGKERHVDCFINYSLTLGIRDRVFFFGKQQNVIPFYQVADTLVIPSYYDPFANVTIEALAMGVYVISSDKNGGSEIINDKGLGRIFHEFSAESVAICLRQAFKTPKTAVSAQAIRNRVADFDFSQQLAKICL